MIGPQILLTQTAIQYDSTPYTNGLCIIVCNIKLLFILNLNNYETIPSPINR